MQTSTKGHILCNLYYTNLILHTLCEVFQPKSDNKKEEEETDSASKMKERIKSIGQRIPAKYILLFVFSINMDVCLTDGKAVLIAQLSFAHAGVARC